MRLRIEWEGNWQSAAMLRSRDGGVFGYIQGARLSREGTVVGFEIDHSVFVAA